MSKGSKILLRIFAFLGVCVITVVILFATGVIEPPPFLDIYNDKKNEQQSNDDTVGAKDVPSALTIELSGEYLEVFNKAVKTLPEDDLNSRILIKVGLQILQSDTIKYKRHLHFYSLDYTNSCSVENKQKYSLTDAITRINADQFIYTDCFGFVRLAHSIACYTINSVNPASVAGLSGLYGYKGAYSQGATFDSMSSLKSGAVVYDTLTGSGTGERHVAMYLYGTGNDIVLMDESGLRKSCSFKTDGYIYSESSNPYKFNKFKNYN